MYVLAVLKQMYTRPFCKYDKKAVDRMHSRMARQSTGHANSPGINTRYIPEFR